MIAGSNVQLGRTLVFAALMVASVAVAGGPQDGMFSGGQAYERFMGRYTMQTWGEDVKQESAQEVVNLRMFPTGFAVDYRFLVNLNGRAVPDVKVNCQYRIDQGNTLQTAGSFLPPEATGSTTVSGTSDANGIAVIPGAQLVNGATYHCEAVLGSAVDGRVLSGQADIVAGMTQPEQAMSVSNPGATDPVIYAMYSNADDPDALMGNDGKLVVTFNRPVELAPSTADCRVAQLFTTDIDADGNMGRFVTEQANNGASETVTADVSADGLTLTVGYKTPETPLDADDRNTVVRFSGIIVRPRGSADTINVRYIGALGACAEANVYGNAQQLRSVRSGAQPSSIRLF